jgi:RNA polymerase sigma factor (sigma-70 family)
MRPTNHDGEIIALLPALRAFARTFARNDNDADDLVQETLIKAISHLHQFTPGTKMKSWMFTIMRNTFYSSVVRRKREGPSPNDGVQDLLKVEQTQEWSVRSGEVRRALMRLPQHQREVITLIGILGVSYEEAARIAKCNIGTVKSRLSRARAQLARELGEECPEGVLEASPQQVETEVTFSTPE